ncbi:MAG TPA: ATP-dependent RecD-like DNA helicase [Anaerolineae bacterium]|nr:ATP-dependent RecD-like DNA helicase [Anaerolineae bacterium]HQI83545.1 ATP-dependent RecD-like DNA helicase [Anaerolineae bacterium]
MSDSTPLQTLEGTLERLTFQNEENGYTVAKLTPKGKSYEVTVIGTLTGVNPGESVRLRGVWTTHPQYGRQFEVREYSVQLPATVEGIRKYLGSGLIKGVGPVNAGRIVDYFGLKTLDVIETEVHRLREVPGVGEKRTAQIARAWEEQKHIKEIMIFLQSHGVSTGLAVKIYKQYADQALAVVRNDPYRLAKDIYGIGFKTADKIAQKMGFAVDAPERIQAGLRYALGTFSDDGHCFAPRDELLTAAAELLEVPREACAPQLDTLIRLEEVVAENGEWQMANGESRTKNQRISESSIQHPVSSIQQPATSNESAIFLPPFFYAERGVANKLRQLQASARDRLAVFRDVEWDKAFAWLAERNPIHLAEQQEAAVRMALTEKVSILTGGPGTGKTTITRSIIQLLLAKRCSVLLCAPTGRAAKRLSEATGLEAKTIHRLLEVKPAEGFRFARDQENPLDADMVIVDETSMVDILLMNHLLKAVEAGSHLLLVGDVDQLPSVGAGNVLRDLIASDVIPVTRLDTIFRQAEDSYIIVNAHRINRGEMPVCNGPARDFFMFTADDAERAADLVLDIVAQRIPAKFGYDADRDIQVLSPMHRGAAGVGELNRRLQETLNPPDARKAQSVHGARTFRVGDRVMQIRNDYDRQVFNGDMGRVTALDLEEHTLTVNFDGALVGYEFTELDELVHAYAVSIHKSQGSEFPVVVIPILTQHYMMLQRNLLYTGVTRAAKLVVLVGNPRAIAIAVHNDKIAQRNTRLTERLLAWTPSSARGYVSG